MSIKQYQIYTLPSEAVVQVTSHIDGDDWNCVYRTGDERQITLSGAFLRKFGEVWA